MKTRMIAVLTLVLLTAGAMPSLGDPDVELTLLVPDGPLKGSVKFTVDYRNPSGHNLTFDLFVTSDNVTWDHLAQDKGSEKRGYADLEWDSALLPNGNYLFRAAATGDDISVQSETVGPIEIWNPADPVIRWASPKAGAIVARTYSFTVNVTGDHGGLEAPPDLYLSGAPPAWTFMGASVPVEGSTIFRRPYDTTGLPDGDYYFKANVTSVHGRYAEAVIGPITMDNDHPPVVELASPAPGTQLRGTVNIEAIASDPDEDMEPEGVVFFYSKQKDDLMKRIGNDPDAGPYSIGWDTSTVPNGAYTVWAHAADIKGATSWDGHNVTVMNPIGVTSMRSIGRSEGGWDIEVTIEKGPKAYPLTVAIEVDTGSGWTPGPVGTIDEEPIESGPIKSVLTVVTNRFPEGNVSVRAIVTDAFGGAGSIAVQDLFRYWPLIAPRVRILPPNGPLKGNASVIAEVIDDDVPLVGPVIFYHSTDNRTWHLLGEGTFYKDKTYRIVWDTTKVANFTDHHIRVEHIDSDGLLGQAYRGGFEVRNEPAPEPETEPPDEMWYETPEGWGYALGGIALIAAILAICAAVAVGISKRARARRERERRREEEMERRSTIGERAELRDRELKRMLVVGSKFKEPVRASAPRGSVPLKPAEKGIREKDDIVIEPPKKVQVAEYEEPAHGRV